MTCKLMLVNWQTIISNMTVHITSEGTDGVDSQTCNTPGNDTSRTVTKDMFVFSTKLQLVQVRVSSYYPGEYQLGTIDLKT